MKTKHPGTRVTSSETIARQLRPNASGGAKLRYFFEEVIVCIEKEGNARDERIDLQTSIESGLDVSDRVREGERQLLNRCRSRLADVISADGNRVPVRNFLLAVTEDIGDKAQRKLRRIDIQTPRDVLFQNVVLNGPVDDRRRDALLPGHGDIHR